MDRIAKISDRVTRDMVSTQSQVPLIIKNIRNTGTERTEANETHEVIPRDHQHS
jgi:hypothetical protein